MRETAGGLYPDLNAASILGNFSRRTKMLVFSFFVTKGLDGKPIVPVDRAYAEAFELAVDTQKLGHLRLLRVDLPRKAILESDKNAENFSKTAKLYGAQEMTERIVLYELDGRTFLGGFQLYRYASGWKICSLHSNLAGLPATVQQYAGAL